MVKVKYVGPHDAVEVPSLQHLVWSFERGVTHEIPGDLVGNLNENPDWEVSGRKAKAPEPVEEPPAPTTAPDNLPTEERG